MKFYTLAPMIHTWNHVYTYFKNRPGDLLIMNITEGDGWEMLCHFLGVSVPDEPFPNVKPGFRPEEKKQLQFHRQISKIRQQITTRLRSTLNRKYRRAIPNYKAQYYRFSPKLMMWYIESQKENNCWNENQPICEDYALYPRRFYCAVSQYDNKKAYDYCFIGGYKTDFFTEKNRRWILDFITSNFTKDSYLKFTDSTTKQNYKTLGDYDFTLSQDGFVPKEHHSGR